MTRALFSDTLPQISVVIISYNTREMTLECLRALAKATNGLSLETIVVDNASTDGSAQAIRSAFPEVIVIENRENVGFGKANNQGFARARGRYFFLLNSDAFVLEGALQALLAEIEKYPKAAIVAPRLLNRDGSLQRSCWPFPTPARAWLDNSGIGPLLRKLGRRDWRNWKHDEAREVEWAIGAALLVRREVWENVGGFDPRFWMYGEETDWQKRIRAGGWTIRFMPGAQVEHWGGASSSDRARLNEASFSSLDLYQLKHHGRAGWLALRTAMVWGQSWRLIFYVLRLLVCPRDRKTRDRARLCWWLIRRQAFSR